MSDNAMMLSAADLQDLEIETFEIETLSEIGTDAAALSSLTVATTSSTTSSSCG